MQCFDTVQLQQTKRNTKTPAMLLSRKYFTSLSQCRIQ